MKKCQEISFQVLSCFALGLGFEEDFFTQVRSCSLCESPASTCAFGFHGNSWSSDLQAKCGQPKGLTMPASACPI